MAASKTTTTVALDLEEEAYYSLEFPNPSDEEIDAHIDAYVRHHKSAHDAHVDLAVTIHRRNLVGPEHLTPF